MQRNGAYITIAGRRVGTAHPFYVIAEIGLNHGGAVDKALQMVDEAARAGASAVKLQTVDATKLVSHQCPAPAHVRAASLTDFFAGFELDEAAHRAVAERARAGGLAFISTPLSIEGVDLLMRVGVDAIKIASGDLTWDALVEHAAGTGKPLILSTGMASLDEVSRAVATARLAGATDIALLHCVSAYPLPEGSENLAAISTLARSFGTPVGLSDHAADTFAVPMAVAFGASLYERHFVLDGDTDAIDAPVSSTPGQIQSVVTVAARARSAVGTGEKRCEGAEAPNRTPSRRGLYATRDLQCGERLTADDVVALRPAAGVAANELPGLIGVPLACEVKAGEAIAHHHLGARVVRRTA